MLLKIITRLGIFLVICPFWQVFLCPQTNVLRHRPSGGVRSVQASVPSHLESHFYLTKFHGRGKLEKILFQQKTSKRIYRGIATPCLMPCCGLTTNLGSLCDLLDLKIMRTRVTPSYPNSTFFWKTATFSTNRVTILFSCNHKSAFCFNFSSEHQ